ncbi:hypothetical protein OQA88_12881 [Cercophora sp. LCS_1]
MKRLRLERLTGQLLAAGPRRCCSPASPVGALRSARLEQPCSSIRSNSTAAALNKAPATVPGHSYDPTELPSPRPEQALRSAKLAALHARLSLPQKIPLQTLARTLVDASADKNPQFNNSNLAFVGQTIINYHVAEWLMCKYPRLPMNIVWEVMKGFAGTQTLHRVARSWGVESAAAPGGEVDPGLLQFDLTNNKLGIALTGLGYQRVEEMRLGGHKWRRGISNRVVFDDDFGNAVKVTPGKEAAEAEGEAEPDSDSHDKEEHSYTSYGNEDTRALAEKAHAYFVRAVVGAVYTHCGRETAKAFVKAHILSRSLEIEKLFRFHNPVVELATLCRREAFEAPVARMLSETGRASRTPVFVVGIYSGKDKLGEAAGPNLDSARYKAAMNALKSWYLYSPGDKVRVPSDMLQDDAKPWEPAHIDIGEVISR